MAELTGPIDPAVLGTWPAGMRVIVRRERPHPRARNSASLRKPMGGGTKRSSPTPPPDNWRSSKPGTGLTPGSRTRSGTPKSPADTGLGRFPSRQFAINTAWLTLTMIAADLIAADLIAADQTAGLSRRWCGACRL